MGTAIAPNRQARMKAVAVGPTAAEERFVNELMNITQPTLEKMSPAERAQRIRKLNNYLDSLGGTGTKRA